MKALFFDGSLRFEDNVPDPVPAEGEALIKVLVAGICRTDIEITRGYTGFKGILGHEFIGRVEKVNGDYPKGILRARVVGELNCGCGVCTYCQKGMSRHCARRTAPGIRGREGVFAEYTTLPVKNLYPVPAGVTDVEAVFTEPLAAAFEITEQVHVQPEHNALVLGDGKLGLLAAFVLAGTGARTVIAGKHTAKLDIARARKIETAWLHQLKRRRAFDIVVEASGSAEGLEKALDLVKPRGTIVLKSTLAPASGTASRILYTTSPPTGIDFSRVVVDEITIVGSRCGPFQPALDAIVTGRIDVKPLISAVFPFSQAMEAFRFAEGKESLKVLIDFKREE